MNEKEFVEFALANDKRDHEIMVGANKEYATDGNKFENFDLIAEIFRRTVPGMEHFTSRHVAIVYGLKHIIAVIKGISIRDEMSGRYSDVRNYMRLMEGIDARDKPRRAEHD